MTFNDKNLEKVVRENINKPTGNLLETDVEKITKLDVENTEEGTVNDISGIEKLTNLQSLSLSDDKISDISSLSGLVNLKVLSLEENNISDYSPAKSYYDKLVYKDFMI